MRAIPRDAKRWTLVAAVLGSGVVFLDATVVTVALPKIGQQLPASLVGVLEGQSYVYSAYLLALSALLIPAGALGDAIGRRRVFIAGLAGFTATSLLCGVAPTLEFLVLARILQGASGALLVPGSLAIITATFEGEERGRAFGIWAGASAVTTIVGPVLGGLLVDTVSWRTVFLLNVLVAVPALWASVRYVAESRDDEASGAIDWTGAIVVALATGGLAFGAVRGQEQEWRDPVAFAALGVGALATIVLPFLLARSKHPLVPLGLFRSRNFSVTNIATLLVYGALYVSLYYLTLFLQGTLGYTAAAAGLTAVPGSLLLVLFSTRFGALAARLGPRRFMAAGPAIMAAGLLWLVRVPQDSAAWVLRFDDPRTWLPPAGFDLDVLPGLLLFGAGLMVLVTPLTSALMASVPARNAGVGSAVNNAISRIGPQLAGAVIFVAITAVFYAGMEARVPALDASNPAVRAAVSPLNPPAASASPAMAAATRGASTDAFRVAMLVSATLLLAGAAVSAVGIRDHAAVPSAEAERDARSREAVGSSTDQ
jgi:EmrB/QacA subfamily drug resistance transporter